MILWEFMVISWWVIHSFGISHDITWYHMIQPTNIGMCCLKECIYTMVILNVTVWCLLGLRGLPSGKLTAGDKLLMPVIWFKIMDPCPRKRPNLWFMCCQHAIDGAIILSNAHVLGPTLQFMGDRRWFNFSFFQEMLQESIILLSMFLII